MNRATTVNIQLHNLYDEWAVERKLSSRYEKESTVMVNDYADTIDWFIADTVILPGKYN